MSKKSEVVRGYGLAMSIGAAMDEVRRELGVSEEEFHILATPEGRSHLKLMIAGIKTKPIVEAVKRALLEFVAKADIPAVTKCLDPKQAFNQKHLWLSSSFRKNVLPRLKSIESAAALSLPYHRLTRNAWDREIIGELDDRHETRWHAIIALTEKQKNGKSGYLLSDSRANIFYFDGLDDVIVDVGWDSGNGRWDVLDWQRGDVQWSAGDQVFSGDSPVPQPI